MMTRLRTTYYNQDTT